MRGGSYEIVQLLLANNIDVTIKGSQGTAKELALTMGSSRAQIRGLIGIEMPPTI